jgi:hypothetical protein
LDLLQFLDILLDTDDDKYNCWGRNYNDLAWLKSTRSEHLLAKLNIPFKCLLQEAAYAVDETWLKEALRKVLEDATMALPPPPGSS